MMTLSRGWIEMPEVKPTSDFLIACAFCGMPLETNWAKNKFEGGVVLMLNPCAKGCSRPTEGKPTRSKCGGCGEVRDACSCDRRVF